MLVHKNSNVYWNARILETGGNRHKTLSSASHQGRPLALKVWPQTSSLTITWELGSHADPQAPELLNQKLGMGSSELGFHQPSPR